jgi:hypothetical protein
MPTINTATANAQLTAYGTRHATATLIIYSGTAPANADASLSGNTVLATHTLAGFGTASARSMAASAIADVAIAATGTATFARLSVGSEVQQLSVGTSATDVIVNSTAYVTGNDSEIVSLTITQ